MLQKKFIRPPRLPAQAQTDALHRRFLPLDFLSGKHPPFVVMSRYSRSGAQERKTTNAEAFYRGHKDDILKIPDAEGKERKTGQFSEI